MVRFSFADAEFVALPEGALWWPARRALVVADLHFEKGSFFARFGQMLPPYDTEATLDLLEPVLARLSPAEVWCLGDSFHDAGGCERLAPETQVRLLALTGATAWTWVLGNHDAGARLADRCGGRLVEEAAVDGIVLRHEADPSDARPEMSGHYHPKLTLTHKGRRLARRCFVRTPTKLVLPAFGTLTGGLDAAGPELRGAIGRPAEALVPVAERLLRFGLAA